MDRDEEMEEDKSGYGSGTGSPVPSIDRNIRALMKEAGYTLFRRANPGGNAEEIERELKKAAIRGRPFIKGPKHPRKYNLKQRIEKVYLELRDVGRGTSNKEVLEALEYESDIIQEIDDEYIYWKTLKGIERNTTIKRFHNILSDIRKKHPR